MNNNIVFSKVHYVKPFTCESGKKKKISLADKKIKVIALSIIVGIFTLGIGGVLTFYLYTAYLKSKTIKSLSSKPTPSESTPITPPPSKPSTPQTSKPIIPPPPPPPHSPKSISPPPAKGHENPPPPLHPPKPILHPPPPLHPPKPISLPPTKDPENPPSKLSIGKKTPEKPLCEKKIKVADKSKTDAAVQELFQKCIFPSVSEMQQMSDTALNNRAIKFMEEAEGYVNSFPKVEVNNDSYEGVVEESLKKYGGVCFGESHNKEAPKKFIYDNLEFFKSQGVSVLFMEEYYLEEQSDIDRYLQGKTVSHEFHQHLNGMRRRWWSDYYVKILDKAKELGIKVIAIDTKKAAKLRREEPRLRVMNFEAASIMQVAKGEKFVAFMGSGHLGQEYSDIYGVAQLMGVPKIPLEQHHGYRSYRNNNISVRKEVNHYNGYQGNFMEAVFSVA